MSRGLSIEDRLRAEALKKQIRDLVEEQCAIAARFARYDQSPVEERLATELAFSENRRLIGKVSQDLLRLVCI